MAIFAIAFSLVSSLIHGRLRMSSRMAARRLRTISCMRALASGGKYFSTYFCPSASPSNWSVDSTQRFQRGFISVAPLRYLPLKAKFSSTNGAESEFATEFEQLPLQINLPVGERRLLHLPVDFLHELGLVNVHVDIGGNLLVLEIGGPVEVRSHRLQLRERGVVIGRRGIAQGDVVERSFGKFGFHRHDGLRRGCRGFLVPSRELEHRGDMLDIFFARFLEARLGLQVVVAIGQAETAGADVGQHPGRLVRILLAAEGERSVHEDVVHLDHHLLQRGHVAGGVDFREPRFDRIHAAGVYAGFVHARAVVVADDLLGAAFGRVLVGGGGFQNVVQLVFADSPGLPALAPARHRSGDGIVGAPGAVGEFVEVIAGLGLCGRDR